MVIQVVLSGHLWLWLHPAADYGLVTPLAGPSLREASYLSSRRCHQSHLPYPNNEKYTPGYDMSDDEFDTGNREVEWGVENEVLNCEKCLYLKEKLSEVRVVRDHPRYTRWLCAWKATFTGRLEDWWAWGKGSEVKGYGC